MLELMVEGTVRAREVEAAVSWLARLETATAVARPETSACVARPLVSTLMPAI